MIDHHYSDNIGGFSTIYIAKAKLLPPDLLGSFESILNYMAVLGKKVHIQQDTGKWEEEPKTGNQGDFFSQKLTWRLAKIRPEVANFTHNHRFCKVVALIKTYNNQWVLVGRPDTPLKMTCKSSTGEGFSGKNEYNLEVSGNTIFASLILPEELSGFSPDNIMGEFSDEFDPIEFF